MGTARERRHDSARLRTSTVRQTGRNQDIQGHGPTYHSATAFFSEEPTVTLTP